MSLGVKEAAERLVALFAGRTADDALAQRVVAELDALAARVRAETAGDGGDGGDRAAAPASPSISVTSADDMATRRRRQVTVDRNEASAVLTGEETSPWLLKPAVAVRRPSGGLVTEPDQDVPAPRAPLRAIAEDEETGEEARAPGGEAPAPAAAGGEAADAAAAPASPSSLLPPVEPRRRSSVTDLGGVGLESLAVRGSVDDVTVVQAFLDHVFFTARPIFIQQDRDPLRSALRSSAARVQFVDYLSKRRLKACKLSQDQFLNMSEVFRDALTAVLEERDMLNGRQMVVIGTTFYTTDVYDGKRSFLQLSVANHAIWEDVGYWTAYVTNDVEQSLAKLQGRAEAERETAAFSLIGSYVYSLTRASVSVDLIRQFVSSLAAQFKLSDDHVQRLDAALTSSSATALAQAEELSDGEEEDGDGDVAGTAAPAAAAASSAASSKSKSLFRSGRAAGGSAPKAEPAMLSVKVIAGRNLAPKDSNGTSDPFCVFKYEKQKFTTAVQKKTLNPEWDEQFVFQVHDEAAVVQLKVWHSDKFTRDFMGVVRLPVSALQDGFPRNEWHYLQARDKKRGKAEDVSGAVRLECQLKSSGGQRPCGLEPGMLAVKIVRARNLNAKDSKGGAADSRDPVCYARLDKSEFKTKVASKSTSPEWNERTSFEIGPQSTEIRFRIWDQGAFTKSDFLGQVHLGLAELGDGAPRLVWHPLHARRSKTSEGVRGDLLVELQYFPFGDGGGSGGARGDGAAAGAAAALSGSGDDERGGGALTLDRAFPTIDDFLSSPLAIHYFAKTLDERDEATLAVLQDVLRYKRMWDGGSDGTSIDLDRVGALAETLAERCKKLGAPVGRGGVGERVADQATADLFDPVEMAFKEQLQSGPLLRFRINPICRDLLVEYAMSDQQRAEPLYVARVYPALRNILLDPLGCKHFTAFAAATLCEENVLFYLQVETFHQSALDAALVDEAARSLHARFIATSAETQVNIPSAMVKRIEEQLAAGPVQPTIFDEAQDEIYTLMERDTFNKFLKTPRALHAFVAESRRDSWARTIDTRFPTVGELCADETGRNFFLRFLRMEFKADLLLFWEEARAFAEYDPHKNNTNHLARHIYNLYIAEGATGEVPISDELKAYIANRIDMPLLPENLFDDAAVASYNVMAESLGRFAASDLGEQFAREAHIWP